MIQATKTAVEALLNADPSVTREQAKAAIDALEGRGSESGGGVAQDRDRVMSRSEVAKMLNCSPKTVSRYAERGIIKPIRLGAKGIRASNGYSAKSVEAALERASA